MSDERTTLSDQGEAGLLAALQPILRRHTAGLPLGTGDDVAITEPVAADLRQVWTTDTMVEGTHFRFWPQNTGRLIGRKLVESNLSDLASKGACPLHALLSFGAPAETPAELAQAFFEGVDAALTAAGCRLIGGDIVLAPQWTLTLALCGTLPATAPIATRARGKPRQRVYVTGSPGESAAGLELLEHKSTPTKPEFAGLIQRHLSPTARVREGEALVRAFPDLSMIDVSDGVAHEANEIARQSGVRITLDVERLPISPALAKFADAAKEDPVNLVLYGGEDYELLFCTTAEEVSVLRVLKEAGCETPVRCIGMVESGNGVYLRRANGKTEPLGPGGFEHFSPHGPG